ncbi:DUF397 domain-containing protein [Streptomyces sp. NPDC059853]|uniref:DUF397 domain-containing protein n=1 Tax=Streptomyces sp. NPDC059853 TaxID=3346973 RepID=UPI00365A11F5
MEPTGRVWQKSSFSGSGPDTNECLEIAAGPDGLGLRETADPDLVLTTGAAALNGLLRAVKAGRLPP